MMLKLVLSLLLMKYQNYITGFRYLIHYNEYNFLTGKNDINQLTKGSAVVFIFSVVFPKMSLILLG